MSAQNELEPLTSYTLLEGVEVMDNEVWCRFVDIYGPVVFSRCRSFGLNEADCADLVQESMLKVAKGISSFLRSTRAKCVDSNSITGVQPAQFRRWLRTVTANTVRDFLRRKKNQERYSHFDSANIEALAEDFSFVDSRDALPSDTISAEFPRARSEQTCLIAAALRARRSRVKEKNWEAFWRTVIQKKPNRIVAEELGMTEKAVRQATYETSRELRVQLAQLVDFDK